MPTGLTVDFSQLRRSIDLRRQQLSDEAIKARLLMAAQAYAEVLRTEIRTRVSVKASGNLEKALCTIVAPWKTPLGWAVGVGDIALVGLPTDAPKSRTTIREFWDWLNKAAAEGEPGAVAAQRAALEAEAARLKARRERAELRERRRRAAAARPAPKPRAPTAAQRRREALRQIRAARAAEETKASGLAKRIRDRWTELKRQGDRPTTSLEDTRHDATRASLVQRALAIRRGIRSIRGRGGAAILERRELRAALQSVRRDLRILRRIRSGR